MDATITNRIARQRRVAYTGPGLLLTERWGATSRTFRVDTITEMIDLCDWREPRRLDYTVRLRGPVQTKSGRDHARLQDYREYRAPVLGTGATHLTGLPEQVSPFLVGPMTLLRDLVAIVTDASGDVVAP